MGVPGRELPVRPPCLPLSPEGRTVAVFSPRAAARLVWCAHTRRLRREWLRLVAAHTQGRPAAGENRGRCRRIAHVCQGGGAGRPPRGHGLRATILPASRGYGERRIIVSRGERAGDGRTPSPHFPRVGSGCLVVHVACGVRTTCKKRGGARVFSGRARGWAQAGVAGLWLMGVLGRELLVRPPSLSTPFIAVFPRGVASGSPCLGRRARIERRNDRHA